MDNNTQNNENNGENGLNNQGSGQNSWDSSQNDLRNSSDSQDGRNADQGNWNGGDHNQNRQNPQNNDPNGWDHSQHGQNPQNNNQNGWNDNQNYWNNSINYRDSRQTNWNTSDSTNNPYYNQPTHSPYRNQGFAVASVVLGILSLMTSCTGILSIPLAALSILFAIMTYRKGKKMNSMAVSGLAMACVGIISGIIVVIRSFSMLPEMMKDPMYRQQMDNLSEALYGRSFEELLKDAYGIEVGE